MPRVKIDYVVSFSSEDPEHPASNLLGWEVSKKRWLCPKGEPSCSVVLQLARAVKVNAVHVGAHHAALVEVLVGRSETPAEPFQVLVPSCVFLSPAESRRGEGAERVRSFRGEQLAAAGAQRWDRLRVVCSQPYNKHCKYGLSFIHIDSPEESAPGAAPALARLAALEPDASSEDEFTPGELFAAHRNNSQTSDTGAQIRQATSQVLNNISDASTKLVKTPIAKPKDVTRQTTAAPADRTREPLLYAPGDDAPHARIDRVLQRHRDGKTKEDAAKPNTDKKQKNDARKERDDKTKEENKQDKKHKNDPRKERDETKEDKHEGKHKNDARNEVKKEDSRGDRQDRGDKVKDKQNKATPAKESRNVPSTSQANEGSKKRPREEQKQSTKAPVEYGSVLRGVVFALSGYANPRRGAVRALALAMGARCERDWNERCNHLICAFPNTPKLKQVRSERGGAAVPIVTAEWIEECHSHRRRLPRRWFATEPAQRAPREPVRAAPAGPSDGAPGADSETECDTDDEIEKVLRKQKKQRSSPAPTSPGPVSPAPSSPGPAPLSPGPAPLSPGPAPLSPAPAERSSDVEFVRDERMRGHVSLQDSDDDTDHEREAGPESIDAGASLPEFLEGRTFVIDASARDAFDPALLARYVRAYGGLVLEESQLEPDSRVDYVLSTAGGARAGAAVLRPDWLWRCHRARSLQPHHHYLLA